MKTKSWGSMILVVAFVGGGAWLLKASAPQRDRAHAQDRGEIANGANPRVAGALSGSGAQAGSAIQAEPHASGATHGMSAPSQAAGDQRSQAQSSSKTNEVYKAELASLVKIRAKVFLSEDEKRERARLLGDADFLRRTGALVREPATAVEEQALQAGALDILLEALGADGHDAAVAELEQVVADHRVEDATLVQSARQNLAGIKAETLFKWTAAEPSSRDTVERLLPGPVSRKIWANVLAEQEQNAAESRALAQSHSH